MINKIRKYLLRQKDIILYNKTVSGSEYYMIKESTIRLSDHIPASGSYPEELNIIVQDSNFVVFYGNRLIIIDNYEQFKSFIKQFIIICDIFKDMINRGLGRRVETTLEQGYCIDGIDMTTGSEKFISPIFKYQVQSFDSFESNQYKILTSKQLDWIKQQNFKNRRAVTEYLRLIRKRIQKL